MHEDERTADPNGVLGTGVVFNPATGKVGRRVRTVGLAAAAEIALDARRAARGWREHSYASRAEVLHAVACRLREQRDSLATLMADEMGKPVAEGWLEVDKCALVCDYYAEHAVRFLAPVPIETEASKSEVTFEPLGVVLAIMPWNYPLWQVFRFAAPAVMAGNTVVLKHALNVQGAAEAIERIVREAGAPEGLLRNVSLSDEDAEALIEHKAIAAVTLTGSTAAGRAVASRCGKALKKAVLELGGSDAYVVLGDAELDLAAEACVTSRLLNCGQSCIAAKRLVVNKSCRQEFERAVVERMAARRLGDPHDPVTALGPMARVDLRDELHRQVLASVDGGASLLLGGVVPNRPGAWYPPTVLTDVGPGTPAYQDELFGPVASIIEAADDEDAIRIANDSRFGLGAAVFSRDVARAQELAERIDAGCCFINDYVRSDPRLPFGGIKQSGYGRELSSFGIREFVNIKTMYVK